MQYLWIIVLSIFGALSRYGVSILFVDTKFQTVIFNLLGAFLLGFCVKRFERIHWSTGLKTGITTGFLGSFTTFSTFSLEVVHFIQSGDVLLLCLYLVITIVGGFICTVFGMKVGAK